MKRVLFIFNGLMKNNGKVGVSGGDVRLFEVIKNTKNYQIELLTNPNGEELVKKLKVPFDNLHVINYVVSGGFVSNLVIAWKSLFGLPGGLSDFEGMVYSSCEHLYDVLPAWRMKIFNKCKWIAVYHWVEDYPWKEVRGGTPWLIRYAYWLNRWISGAIIKYWADEILAVGPTTYEKLVSMKKINKKKLKMVYCGVEYEKITKLAHRKIKDKGKKYDALFMKRLNYGKGILDLLEIWKRVCQKKPKARLAIMGDGPQEVIDKINSFIKKNELENNIDMLGVVYDFEKKFEVMNSAKLFVLPTHEENWAIVIGEAMAVGLPIICYDLKEIKPIWEDEVEWVQLGKIDEFARKILKYLDDSRLRSLKAKKGVKFIKKYDWKEIGGNELLITNY